VERGDEPLDHPVHAAGPGRALSPSPSGVNGDAAARTKAPLWAWLALAVLALAPAVFWRGGVLEEETIVFLNHYLDGRSAIEKVFDPHGNDFDTYQARELSYLFDFVDAQWLSALLRRGVVLFIPPSAILASILTGVVFVRGSGRTFPGLPGATRALTLLVLLTNYVFLTTMGLFYRATKPLLVPVLLGTLFFVWARLRPGTTTSPGRDFAGLFALGCLMSAFDRQGFFYAAVLTGLLALFWAVRRRGAALGLGAAAATLVSAAYNYLIGPYLIHAVNGYWPRFNYQRMPLRKLTDPAYYLKAAELLPAYAATLFGGFPVWIFALLALAALAAWVRLRQSASGDQGMPRPGVPGLGITLVLLFLGSQVFMFAAMIMRYPQVYDWADHRLWYYPWPFQALLVFGLLIALDAIWPRTGMHGRRAIDGALVLLAVANVAHWPQNRAISLHSDWFPKIHDQTGRLSSSLETGRVDPQLYGAYREFLHFTWDLSPLLASRVTAEVCEGAGFYRTVLREGRLFAWAERRASLELVTGEAGAYAVRGDLWLRPGEVVVVSRAGGEIGRFPSRADTEGTVPLTLDLTLPAGRTELTFQSNLPERQVGRVRERKAAAFGFFVPVLQRSGPRSP
jgi:hypothetical protein